MASFVSHSGYTPAQTPGFIWTSLWGSMDRVSRIMPSPAIPYQIGEACWEIREETNNILSKPDNNAQKKEEKNETPTHIENEHDNDVHDNVHDIGEITLHEGQREDFDRYQKTLKAIGKNRIFFTQFYTALNPFFKDGNTILDIISILLQEENNEENVRLVALRKELSAGSFRLLIEHLWRYIRDKKSGIAEKEMITKSFAFTAGVPKEFENFEKTFNEL